MRTTEETRRDAYIGRKELEDGRVEVIGKTLDELTNRSDAVWKAVI